MGTGSVSHQIAHQMVMAAVHAGAKGKSSKYQQQARTVAAASGPSASISCGKVKTRNIGRV